MKTITKNISTQLLMLAFLLGVLSTGEVQAGDRPDGLYISVGSGEECHLSSVSATGYDATDLIPSGWQIDREFLRRKGPGDLLKVTASKARWNGQNYVAYLLVQWGNLEGVATCGPSNWDGSVKVDDGRAYVVKTIGFEQPAPAGWRGGLQLTPKQANKLAKLREELDEELVKAELKYREHVAEAYDEIRNPAKLARKLDEIEQDYDEDVAEAQEEYQQEVAKLLADAQANNPAAGDEVIATDDEEQVAWQATVNGGSDGVLIKLVMEDDDEDVVVKAGGLKIKFETTPQRVTPTIVAVRQPAVSSTVTVVHTGRYLHLAPHYSGAHSGRYLHRSVTAHRQMRRPAVPLQRRVLRRRHDQPGRSQHHDRHRHDSSTTLRRQVTPARTTGYTRAGGGHTGTYSQGRGARDARGGIRQRRR